MILASKKTKNWKFEGVSHRCTLLGTKNGLQKLRNLNKQRLIVSKHVQRNEKLYQSSSIQVEINAPTINNHDLEQIPDPDIALKSTKPVIEKFDCEVEGNVNAGEKLQPFEGSSTIDREFRSRSGRRYLEKMKRSKKGSVICSKVHIKWRDFFKGFH